MHSREPVDTQTNKMLLKLVEAVRVDADILAVILFGSVARGEANASSDVDVCLVLKKEFSDAALAAKKRLEYLGRFDADITIFQQLPLYIRQRVLKDARVLFVRNDDELYDIALDTVRAFEDFRPFYHDYLNEVARVGS